MRILQVLNFYRSITWLEIILDWTRHDTTEDFECLIDVFRIVECKGRVEIELRYRDLYRLWNPTLPPQRPYSGKALSALMQHLKA
jgi:hypothetical protein